MQHRNRAPLIVGIIVIVAFLALGIRNSISSKSISTTTNQTTTASATTNIDFKKNATSFKNVAVSLYGNCVVIGDTIYTDWGNIIQNGKVTRDDGTQITDASKLIQDDYKALESDGTTSAIEGNLTQLELVMKGLKNSTDSSTKDEYKDIQNIHKSIQTLLKFVKTPIKDYSATNYKSQQKKYEELAGDVETYLALFSA